MIRKHITPRKNWQNIVDSQGLPYHSAGGTYWQDDVYYELSEREHEEIYTVTESLHSKIWLCVSQLMQKEESRNRVRGYMRNSGMDDKTIDVIFNSWDNVGKYKSRSTYGRFDLTYGTDGRLHMFEYNADTPVVLVETAYCQWEWLKDQFGEENIDVSVTQFNEMYPLLLEAFTSMRNQGIKDILFMCDQGQIGEVYEYEASCLYLVEVASDAGMNARFRFAGDLKVDFNGDAIITDEEDRKPDAIFKLYPSEWMVEDLREAGHKAPHTVLSANNMFQEPYKLLMGGKWLLPELFAMYPQVKEIPKAWHTREECIDRKVVAKSYYGRIGMEVEVLEPGQETSLKDCVIYQEYVESQTYGDKGHKAVFGSWVINGYAAGIGIREQVTDITTDSCTFASHVVKLENRGAF